MPVIGISLLSSCHADRGEESRPSSATCQCPSVPHASAHQCHISVHTSAHQCHISVPI
ncbi:unnamed protein product [Staurois parvus]|uniref:Uncharacterized protein n=1 Tax=Staurois parvus TaxID=386267 RepID=A0ABN9G5K8_9NEOB|nr:unnamed protein product [Staurois parvus]